MSGQKITTSLWFKDQALEAAEFYGSLLPNSHVGRVTRFGEGSPFPAGSVVAVEFQLAGQQFLAINGNPAFQFTDSTSLLINCDSQSELDDLWEKLTANGGQPVQCGWLRDRYGLAWQIAPAIMPQLLNSPDEGVRNRVMQAMMQMVKLDIAALQRAAAG